MSTNTSGSEQGRQALLAYLLTEGYESWRIRRTDRFRSVDWDVYEQTTEVDVCLDQALLEGARFARGVESVQSSSKRKAPEGQADDGVDAYIPVAWVSSPLMGFSMWADGREVVTLSRHQTADLLSRVVGRVLQTGLEHDLIPAVDSPDLQECLLADLAWVLTAVDPHSLATSSTLRGLTVPLDGSVNAKVLADWMSQNRVQAGWMSDDPIDLAVELNAVLGESERLREELESSHRSGYLVGGSTDAANPCMNPILLHMSFLKMLDSRATTTAATDPEVRRTFKYFLVLCEYWLRVLSALLADSQTLYVAHSGSPPSSEVLLRARAADALLRQLFRIGQSWPLVVRYQMAVGRATRFSFSQVIFSPTRSAYYEDETRRKRRAREALIVGLRRPLWWLQSTASSFADLWHMRRGSRTKAYSQKDSQSYRLALRDARSSHVEVRCEGKELLLRPKSAFVKLDRVNVPNALVAKCLSKWWFRPFFARHQCLSAESVFGRVSDSSERLHHFYTTKSVRESMRPAKGAMVRDDLAGQPLLVIRYKVTPWVTWTNRFVILCTVVLAALLLRASLTDVHLAVSYGEGLSWGAGFSTLFKLALPFLLAAVLLFAFEKHNDLLVAEVIGRQSVYVLVAAIIVVVSALLRSTVTAPGYLPEVPSWLDFVPNWWRWSGSHYADHEVGIVVILLVGLLAFVALGVVFVMVRLFVWKIIVALGDRRRTSKEQTDAV